MSSIELSGGTVDYLDTGGDGPTLVLLHGFLMDGTLWTDVVDALSADYRCVVPTLPMGAHRRPMDADADLSLPGIAALVVELIDRLGLADVCLVGNDTGGALVQLILAGGTATDRVGRAALVSCDAFDNFPPGLTGRTVVRAGRLSPSMFGLFMQQMRLRPVRRLPLAFGWLTKRGDAVTRRWLDPVLARSDERRGLRRDTVRMLRAAGAQPTLLIDAAERLPDFTGPVLVAWAADDRVMPAEHGRRLAATFAQGRLVEIEDSYTLVPLDRPEALAGLIRDFVPAPVDR